MPDATDHATKTHAVQSCLRVRSGAGEVEIQSLWPLGSLLHTHVLSESEAVAMAEDLLRRVTTMRELRAGAIIDSEVA
jgi:hypothetical protein